jgi:hypothetical protein
MDEMDKTNEKVCQTTHHPSITSLLVGWLVAVGSLWLSTT